MKDDFITYKEVGLSCCTCQSSILENTLPPVSEVKADLIHTKKVGLPCCTCQSSILENTLPSVFEVKADFNADKESGIALLHMSVIYARKHTIPCFLGNGRPLILTKRVGVCCAGRRWNGWHGEGPRIRNRKRNCRHSETSVPTWMRKSRRIWPTGCVCPPPLPPVSLSFFLFFIVFTTFFTCRVSTHEHCHVLFSFSILYWIVPRFLARLLWRKYRTYNRRLAHTRRSGQWQTIVDYWIAISRLEMWPMCPVVDVQVPLQATG